MISINHQSQILQAAYEAGEAIMEIYETSFAVETKSDNSPITLADRNANAIILQYLEPLGIPIISEETEALPYEIRKEWKRCFIVDPLDGTKEFVDRNGDFTVNIALVENGKPVFGVIYIPVTRELYVGDVALEKVDKARIGKGENVLLEVQEKGSSIVFAKAEKENKIVRLAGSRSHMNKETLNFAKILEASGKEVQWVSRGSSLKFCLLVEGKVDMYPRFSPTMEWDTAAGQAICNAAGFEVIEYRSKEVMSYNRPNLLNGSFVVR